MHRSVFKQEAIAALQVKSGGKYIDATFGEGGHSAEIQALGGMVLGIEADERQYQKHTQSSITVVHGNFRDIADIAHTNNFYPVDGILFDLGLSMEQLNQSRRGFSYRKTEEPLDMRIGDTDLTASELIQKTEAEELKHILIKYSEDQHAESIAEEIIAIRKRQPFTTVADLTGVIRRVLERKHITNEQVIDKTNARIFQAMRIFVNDEFDAIRQALEQSLSILIPHGRIVVITFHSLEDRIVKLFARERATMLKQDRIDVEKERKLFTFERSAQLRVLEKIS